MRGLALGVLCVAAVALVCIACGGNGTKAPTETATTVATTTPQAVASPISDALLDDVIGLAVQLGTMTREQAVCVFQLHPEIYREFLSASGITTTGSVDTAALKQQIEDLKREYVVQLDTCFTDRGG